MYWITKKCKTLENLVMKINFFYQRDMKKIAATSILLKHLIQISTETPLNYL